MKPKRRFDRQTIKERREKVLAYLQASATPVTATQAARDLGLEKQLVNNDLMRFLDMGTVVKDCSARWAIPKGVILSDLLPEATH